MTRLFDSMQLQFVKIFCNKVKAQFHLSVSSQLLTCWVTNYIWGLKFQRLPLSEACWIAIRVRRRHWIYWRWFFGVISVFCFEDTAGWSQTVQWGLAPGSYLEQHETSFLARPPDSDYVAVLDVRPLFRISSFTFFRLTKRHQQFLQGDSVCVCVRVRQQANKSTLILRDTLVTVLKSIQVLKHALFYQILFSHSSLAELWSHPHQHTIRRHPICTQTHLSLGQSPRWP